MSIIYDALKKVEETSSKTVNRITKFKISKGLIRPKPKIFLIFLLLFCLGLIIANILFVIFKWPLPNKTSVEVKNQIQISKGQKIPIRQESQLETASDVPTESKKESKDAFILNGVFFSNDEGYALINNRIVKEGDKIDEATVVRIALGEAELELQGKIIRLSSSNVQ